MAKEMPSKGAGPEDSACDTNLIDELCADFFALFLRDGQRMGDLSTLTELCVPRAVFFSRRGPSHLGEALPSFLRSRQQILSDGTLTNFSEREVESRTTVVGGIAMRRSLYEKSGCMQGAWFQQRGVKLLQLVRTSAGWRICSVLWEDEPAIPLDRPSRPPACAAGEQGAIQSDAGGG